MTTPIPPFDLKFAWLIKRRIHLAKNTQIETSHLNGNRGTKPRSIIVWNRGRAKGGSILHKWTDGNSISQRLVFRLVASGLCLGIVKRGSWHFSLLSLHFEDREEILEKNVWVYEELLWILCIYIQGSLLKIVFF